jgi:hypothetical protein
VQFAPLFLGYPALEKLCQRASSSVCCWARFTGCLMFTILFWNINRKNLVQDIAWLCHHHDVDVLILAESQISDDAIVTALNLQRSDELYIARFNHLSPRLACFFRYPLQSIRPVLDEKHVSIRQISSPLEPSLLLVGVHLPSKLRLDEREQMAHAIRVSAEIQEAEVLVGHTRTLVIGDFNMNPFDPGLVASDGFHAVMDQTIARKGSRMVKGIRKPFFYNPMWGLMGDRSPGASGTYYYSREYISYFWNIFDQVLIRPDLLDSFPQDGVQVISEIGTKQLVGKNGLSQFASDHLPLLVKLELARRTNNG